MLNQDPLLDLPTEVADHAPAREVSELRLVTVLAATPPSADDPERLRRLLDETLASVRDVLDRYGGSLQRFGPERLVAFFGADGPADDDAERAVLAARELGLSAGVATGEVVQGAGAVVTRADELARVGGIRLDERTAALVRAERRLDAPLAGREEELAHLRAALAAARDEGRCRVVTVVGEPGIGKTRLARELALREETRTTVLVARCIAHGQGVTFLPLLGALRGAEPEHALAAELDAELVLARLSALAEGAQTAPLGESYWAVRRLLEALARTRPSSSSSTTSTGPSRPSSTWSTTSPTVPTRRCSSSASHGRSWSGRSASGSRSAPLGEEEAREIVAGTAVVDEETLERIVELAEGNALYAEQLASFAADGGEGLPPTLEAVLAGRLGRLDAAERSVLQRAAVIGREFSLGAVAALAEGEVAPDLLALSRAGFVHPAASADPGDDGYTFHHVLLRDAAYGSLTKADRADLHERAAAWIDRDGRGDDAIAGHHLEQAVRYRRELGEDADELAARAGERLGEAGMRAWRANDVAATAGLLGRAVRLLPPGEHRAELQLEQSLALRLQDRPEEAEESIRSAELYARSPPARSDCGREPTAIECTPGSCRVSSSSTRPWRCSPTAMPVLEGARDSRGLARAEITLSNVHWFAGRHDELRRGRGACGAATT